ncbi:MAG: CPBP family intramembrane glutamic endopeptidase [Archaeoglobaceae archaeon]
MLGIKGWQEPRFVSMVYLTLIVFAEVAIIYNVSLGILLHSVILFALLIHGSLMEVGLNKFLISLSLAPLIRILSITMPLSYFSLNMWFYIISICVLAAAFACIYLQGVSPFQVGIKLPRWRDLPWEIAVIVIAVPFGIVEYLILKPDPLIFVSLTTLLSVSLMLIVSTGFMEELVFRGLIQHHSTNNLGFWGVPFVAVLFGSLHIGNVSIADFILTTAVGLVFGMTVRRTGSILGVTISHGLINIILFLVAPFYL